MYTNPINISSNESLIMGKKLVNKKEWVIATTGFIIAGVLSFLMGFFHEMEALEPILSPFLSLFYFFVWFATPFLLIFNFFSSFTVAGKKEISLWLKIFYFVEIIIVISLVFSSFFLSEYDNFLINRMDSLFLGGHILGYLFFPYLIGFWLEKKLKGHKIFVGILIFIILSSLFIFLPSNSMWNSILEVLVFPFIAPIFIIVGGPSF